MVSKQPDTYTRHIVGIVNGINNVEYLMLHLGYVVDYKWQNLFDNLCPVPLPLPSASEIFFTPRIFTPNVFGPTI